ncbi:ras-related protein Ral-A isoform X2 [Suricata suricatta]|uniref:ras-related protein Ral-A isoform X2 n=1 Tax=Suricata suricatta TaxID=37032 RepID=UPI0011559584|nr:ras-related protein Ral-A isoform X2 [Suricata suricatta]
MGPPFDPSATPDLRCPRGSSALSKGSQTIGGDEFSRDQRFRYMRHGAVTETLQPGQKTDQTTFKNSARDKPHHITSSTLENPGHGRVASTLDSQGEATAPRKQDGGHCFPLLPREPPPGPQKRDKDVAAPTPRSGNLPATPGPPGGDSTSPGAGSRGWGRPKGRAARPRHAEGGRLLACTLLAIVLQLRPPTPSSPFADGSYSPASPAPLPSAPEVICGGCCRAARRRVDLWRAERPESSSSSSCRPGSAAARRTCPSAFRGGEPPRRPGPTSLRPNSAQSRLSEPAGRQTGLQCSSISQQDLTVNQLL